MNICQRCKEEDEDGDLRTLWMACGYEMKEMEMPFTKEELASNFLSIPDFYTLEVCKPCRSDWMHFIRLWWDATPNHSVPSPNSGIFIRDLGATREVSKEHWEKYFASKKNES
jgi:hypothetical protein